MNIGDLFVSYKQVSDKNSNVTEQTPEFTFPWDNNIPGFVNQEPSDDFSSFWNQLSFNKYSDFQDFDFESDSSNQNFNFFTNIQSEKDNSEKQDSSTKTKVNGVSDFMFRNALYMEGSQGLTAKRLSYFGESFVTGPYGMTQHFNKNGKATRPFKNGETVSQEYALQNARNYYNGSANEWKRLLSGKSGLTQNKLDALVSASGGTAKSKKYLQKFVLTNWGNDEKIANFLRTFATTAAGNGEKQPGLILRRQYEADLFLGRARDFKWYQQNRKLYGV